MKKTVWIGLILLALLAFSAYGTMVYWIETNFSSPKLVLADESGGISSSIVLAAQSLPQALAINRGTNAVFWTELGFLGAKIRSVNPGLSDTSTVVSLQSCLRGIAIDSTKGKIYWTATNLFTGPGIYRSNLDGSSVELLEFFGAASVNTPQGIAVDEKKQMLYWADFGAGAIEEAAASPQAAWRPIVTGLSGPVGIALETDSGYVYWTDANAGKIGRSMLDGSGPTTILTNLNRPQYIGIDRTGGRMFWTEFGAKLVRSSKLDGTDTLTLAKTLFSPCGIAVAPQLPVSARPIQTSSIPGVYSVFVSSANPLSRIISIRYRLPQESSVAIEVFTVQSRRLNLLFMPRQAPGYYRRDVDASRLAAGAYVVRFTAGHFVSTIKYTVLR